MRKQRIADANVGSDGATEIAGKKDGPEDARRRNAVESKASEQNDSQWSDYAGGVAEFYRGVDDHRRLDELHNAIHEEEENAEGAQHTAGPELRFGEGGGLRSIP